MDFDSLHSSSKEPWPPPLNKEKVVFLDRDGTISQENPIEKASEEIDLLPSVAQALKELNDHGFYTVLITNQSRVGRGSLTEERLREVHQDLEKQLEKQGARLDCILYCPHVTDAQGEYQLDCDWKKPNSGMLKFIARKFDVNLKKTFMIGDTVRDIKAGKEVGAITILVGGGESETKPDYECGNLLEAVKIIEKDVWFKNQTP